MFTSGRLQSTLYSEINNTEPGFETGEFPASISFIFWVNSARTPNNTKGSNKRRRKRKD
jgi:hypothetical protein